MKKLIIFDLDGTLLNTIADLGNACNYALSKLGYSKHPVSSYNYMVGNGVNQLIRRAAPDAGPEQLAELVSHFREYYSAHLAENTKPYPGVAELLQRLREADIKTAVCSNKFQGAVDQLIDHYFPSIDFAAVLGENEGIPRKPDPSMIFAVLNEAPTPKPEVLLVGDSAIDMETARRACIDSAGVTWGFRPVTELRSAQADYIVSSAEEIWDLANRDGLTPLG